MGKISIEELRQMEEFEREIASQDNKGLKFKTATKEDKQTFSTNASVYRFEFPKMTAEQGLKLFYRLHSFWQYNKKEFENDTAICFGFSDHKSWTPYSMVTTAKGGRPCKIFNAHTRYKRTPHIHLYTIGKSAHKIMTRIYDNERKHFNLKPVKNCIWSQKKYCPHYAEWQCRPYEEHGNFEQFFDDDELNF